MPFFLQLISLIFSITFILVFIALSRKKAIKPFYSTLWLFVSLFMLSVVLFEEFYKNIATAFGLTDASFLIIITLLSFLLIYVLYLSLKISEMGDRIQELISYTSILENKIRKNENDKTN